MKSVDVLRKSSVNQQQQTQIHNANENLHKNLNSVYFFIVRLCSFCFKSAAQFSTLSLTCLNKIIHMSWSQNNFPTRKTICAL